MVIVGRNLYSLRKLTTSTIQVKRLATMPQITEYALAQGTPLPPLAKDTLRLYSMRLCPFAQRTRLVLAYKNIPHEVVNVNLRYKPEWFLARNPVGLVPVLEHNDRIVYESAVCGDYLEEVYPQNRLYPDCPYKKAQIKMLMEIYSQVVSGFYGILRGKTEKDKTRAKRTIEKHLDIYERALQGNYFGGDHPCMLDFHMWPWIERFGVMREFNNTEPLPSSKYPKLKVWEETMKSHPAVKITMMETAHHAEFAMSLAQKNPQYDIGLPSQL